MNREKTIERILTDESTSWSVKTIYIWIAYTGQRTTLTSAIASAIWKITKYTETTSWSDKDTIKYCVLDTDGNLSEDYQFIWNNRLTYNYG